MGVFLWFLYQIKELEMLFHPRRYNLMSENILNYEKKFISVFLYIFLLNWGPDTGNCLSPERSEIVGKFRDYNDYSALWLNVVASTFGADTVHSV